MKKVPGQVFDAIMSFTSGTGSGDSDPDSDSDSSDASYEDSDTGTSPVSVTPNTISVRRGEAMSRNSQTTGTTTTSTIAPAKVAAASPSAMTPPTRPAQRKKASPHAKFPDTTSSPGAAKTKGAGLTKHKRKHKPHTTAAASSPSSHSGVSKKRVPKPSNAAKLEGRLPLASLQKLQLRSGVLRAGWKDLEMVVRDSIDSDLDGILRNAVLEMRMAGRKTLFLADVQHSLQRAGTHFYG